MKKTVWMMIPILFSLCLTSCSSRKIHSEHLSREMLFPYGTYKHKVRIKTTATASAESKEFSFNGVVQIHPETIRITVLSPFSTTLVRIQEDRQTGKVEFVSYLESFKKYESKFQDYYSILKYLLIAPESPSVQDKLRILHKNEQGLPDEIETVGLDQNAIFRFNKYDDNKIPEEVRIEHPRFQVDIRVSGYEV